MADNKTIGGLQTLEILNLESLLEDECKCESEHPATRLGVTDDGCSVVATHRAISCRVNLLACENRAKFARSLMAKPRFTCSGCGNRASDCWRIVPI